MKITVNGKEADVSEGMPLAEFLDQRGFVQAKAIVEYNGQILVGEGWQDVILSPGDRMEIVTFVGGG